MTFVSESLARRIERAECQMLADVTRAAARRRATEAVVVELAGGVATLGAPGSPLNKLAGLGFAGVPSDAELGAVERAFGERGTPLQVELANLADPAVGAWLTGRGYTLRGFENVLVRPIEPARAGGAPPQGLDVGLDAAEQLDAWIELVVTGFASPDAQGTPSHEEFPRDVLVEALRDMDADGGTLRFVATREGARAGAASLRMAHGIAQLCGATTLPEHRRRGVQSALLAARLEHAGRAGCEFAVVTTQPGSKSQENVQRLGFELAYTRAVLVREG